MANKTKETKETKEKNKTNKIKQTKQLNNSEFQIILKIIPLQFLKDYIP